MPQAFRFEPPECEVATAGFLGFSGMTNGELIDALVLHKIDVLITLDQNIEYQNKLSARGISLIVLLGKSNRIHDLQKHAPAVRAALRFIQPGQIVHVPHPEPWVYDPLLLNPLSPSPSTNFPNSSRPICSPIIFLYFAHAAATALDRTNPSTFSATRSAVNFFG